MRANVVMRMFVTQTYEAVAELSLCSIYSPGTLMICILKTQNPRKAMLVEMHNLRSDDYEDQILCGGNSLFNCLRKCLLCVNRTVEFWVCVFLSWH